MHQDKTFDKQSYSGKHIHNEEYDTCLFLNCDFEGANLANTTFIECTFEDCNFSNVILENSGFKDVRFVNCKMVGADFSVVNPFLLELRFEDSNLKLASFYQQKLIGIRFDHCNLDEVDFTETQLTGAVFDGCDMDGAIFENSLLEKANFVTASNYSIDPEMNYIKGAKFSIEGLEGLLRKHNINVIS